MDQYLSLDMLTLLEGVALCYFMGFSNIKDLVHTTKHSGTQYRRNHAGYLQLGAATAEAIVSVALGNSTLAKLR